MESAFVGGIDGLYDGTTDGDGVGFDVGLFVGDSVGSSVGDGVGLDVGDGAIISILFLNIYTNQRIQTWRWRGGGTFCG